MLEDFIKVNVRKIRSMTLKKMENIVNIGIHSSGTLPKLK